MTTYRTVSIDGLDIFYREAGSRDNPTILLLHGFPTSSHMFRNLIPALADKFHLVAPDYPGYGNSSMPTVNEFDYTFDRLAEIVEKFIAAIALKKYSLYVMDYGAPIGYRIAAKYPERVQSLIVQNGNAYEEGLREFWEPIKAYWQERSPENAEKLKYLVTLEATKWQYTNGVRNLEAISPDTWTIDQHFLDRPGNGEIQLALLYSYGTNPPLYPQWQEYFRKHQPPTLIVWGKNDYIFPPEGAHPYQRDLKDVELHLLDTGHFALEEDGDAIATWAEYLSWYRHFLGIQVRYQTKLVRIEPVAGFFRLHLEVNGVPLLETTRKIIFANGVAGTGGSYIPPILADLPRTLYAHTADAIDFEALRGKTVAVLGAAASAFDAAAVALESGAKAVHLFVRRSAIASLSVLRVRDYPGAYDNYPQLPDAARWFQAWHFRQAGTAPPPNSIKRAIAFPNFHIHLSAPWKSARKLGDAEAAAKGERIAIEVNDDVFEFDFAIAGTGYFVDPTKRPELCHFNRLFTIYQRRMSWLLK
ncbi:MAG: alpha/beta fold hydrolase [Nostoc sp.]|uniref:alpha/beta fold hydrolase n=1 Tax=Nostoc sp. TaxID=1180 RepID=UPI002FF9349C